MSYAITLFEPNPLIYQYCKNLQRSALKERQTKQILFDSLMDTLDRCYNKHPELCDKIRKLQVRVQTLTKGVPATEAVMDTNIHSADRELDVAQELLLKKAYKQAASIAHPDKGGSNDDFASINAAYRAKDLGSLTEFVISKNKTLVEQVEYWKSEILKPDMKLKEFQAQPEFKIIRSYVSGRQEEAYSLAKVVLNYKLSYLTQQSLQTRKATHHGS